MKLVPGLQNQIKRVVIANSCSVLIKGTLKREILKEPYTIWNEITQAAKFWLFITQLGIKLLLKDIFIHFFLEKPVLGDPSKYPSQSLNFQKDGKTYQLNILN